MVLLAAYSIQPYLEKMHASHAKRTGYGNRTYCKIATKNLYVLVKQVIELGDILVHIPTEFVWFLFSYEYFRYDYCCMP